MDARSEVSVPEAAERGADEPAEFEGEAESYPWDTGEPPLLACLVRERRFGLAVSLARAADETPLRQRVLSLLTAAFTCRPESVEVLLPDLLPQAGEAEMPGDEARVLLAAVLRLGLVQGYPVHSLPALMDRAQVEDTPWADFLHAAADAVQHGYRRHADGANPGGAGPVEEWATLAPRALELRDQLARRGTILARATQVVHHLARADQPLGQVLTDIANLAGTGPAGAQADSPQMKRLTRTARLLADPAWRKQQAASAEVSTRRRAITGTAWKQIDESFTSVEVLLSETLRCSGKVRAAAATPRGPDPAGNLWHALNGVPDEPVVRTVGEASIAALVSWFSADDGDEADTLEQVINVALVPLFELLWTAEGEPGRPPTIAQLMPVIRGREMTDVIRGYLNVGNLDMARTLIAECADGAAVFDDEVRHAAQTARTRVEEARSRAELAVAHLRALNEDETARGLAVRFGRLKDIGPGRYDLTLRELGEIARHAEKQLAAVRSSLLARAEAVEGPEADRARIRQRLDEGDEVTAIEFLTLAESGQALPEAAAPAGDRFGAFYPQLVACAAQELAAGTDAADAVRKALGQTANPHSRVLADGLAAWRALRRLRTGEGHQRWLADLLRMIGLVPRRDHWLHNVSHTHRAGFATFRARATPVQQSLVPQFGTQANGSYDLTLAWDTSTASRLLDLVPERRRTAANIIFYFGVLDVQQRRTLRRLTASDGKAFSPLVIDDAVIGWLAGQEEAGWQLTQEVTLPMTTINPYTPFAAGEVPDEMFVGRDEERLAIESPTGSMFVYGGRQLGKSALLRRVEGMFTDIPARDGTASGPPPTGRVAVYLDLRALSIGEALEPAALWMVLSQRLQDVNVLQKTSPQAGPQTIVKRVESWLQADDSNRLLLLLDEADMFLTADFNAGGADNAGRFPTLNLLKGLMTLTKRRFKPVFAGLHQVQRFHDSSNTPVAHGGEDICIGPLAARDAYNLVVGPLRALGYELESPELAWRLLLATNYQPCLVQIVCEALITHLHTRPLPEHGGRIVVKSADVDTVVNQPRVRELVEQRFRWTINLDSRYRVIALVVALFTLSTDSGDMFEPDELHEYCEMAWPTGFDRDMLTSKEFRRYLDELVGLGVLHQRAGSFGLRSPNVISLLGSRQSIENELAEAAQHLELPYEYNPSLNRRLMPAQNGPLEARSPLTDQDLVNVIGTERMRGRAVTLVVGSTALGINRVGDVLRARASELDLDLHLVDPVGAMAQTEAAGRARRYLVVDYTGEPAPGDPAPVEVARRIKRAASLGGAVVVGQHWLARLDLSAAADVELVALRRWSIESFRPWHDFPFDSPQLRKQLHRTTSGWPELVEHATAMARHGTPQDQALDRLRRPFTDAAAARKFLRRVGVDESVAREWSQWLADTGSNGDVEVVPAQLADLGIFLPDPPLRLEMLQWLDAVELTRDGWVLDRVIAQAALLLEG